MKMYSQNRFVSALAIFFGAVTAPLLFNAAGLPGGWIFEGPAQFVLTVAATWGLMFAFSCAENWVANRLPALRKPSQD